MPEPDLEELPSRRSTAFGSNGVIVTDPRKADVAISF